MLAAKLLAAMLAGVAAHQGRPTLERTLGRGWLELACYAAGVILGLPFVLIIADDLHEINNPQQRTIAAYLLSFLSIGAGVGVAWFVEGLQTDPHGEHPYG
ncbi:MAG: hypothetical protein JW900_04445 [Anaerolineae bacterium]|nr:hypothetical protein [Anaerolineae bacterium]